MERRDEWALTELDAAIGIVGATVGAAFGPVGSILGAFVGPYAKLAVVRFMDLRTRVGAVVDLEDDELRRRLEGNEPLAQMIADVVRGTVESDLEAKRRLLARAAIRALKDEAVVEEESVFVRTAIAVDTIDVRVLATIESVARSGCPTRRSPERRRAWRWWLGRRPRGSWPGSSSVLRRPVSVLPPGTALEARKGLPRPAPRAAPAPKE